MRPRLAEITQGPWGQARLFFQRHGRRGVSLGGVADRAGSSPAAFVPLTLASGSPAPDGGRDSLCAGPKHSELLSDLL